MRIVAEFSEAKVHYDYRDPRTPPPQQFIYMLKRSFMERARVQSTVPPSSRALGGHVGNRDTVQ